MKKLLSVLTIALVISGFSMNTAEAQIKDNVVKMNIFGAIVGQYQLSYERALNDKMSVQLSAGLISRDWDLTVGGAGSTQEDRGIIVIPEFRYYFAEAPKGAYAGAFIRYRSVTQSVDYTGFDQNLNTATYTAENTRSAIGGGILIGYQALISDAVALDVQIGPQYKSISESFKTNDPNQGTVVSFEGEGDGVGVRFAFSLGIAF